MTLYNATNIFMIQNANDQNRYQNKLRQFYYKIQHLLQDMTILLQNVTVIRKCKVHYKIRQHNHH